jgi:hypothetical protein
MTYFHQRQYCRTQEQVISFPRKKTKTKSSKNSRANCFKLTSKQFLFSKCKIKISRFILNRYSFTKLKRREMREWSLKIIICLSHWQNTLIDNDQYKGATLYLEGKSIPSREKKKGTFPTTRQGGIVVYKRQLDPFSKWHRMFLAVRRGVMNDPLKLFDETENL